MKCSGRVAVWQWNRHELALPSAMSVMAAEPFDPAAVLSPVLDMAVRVVPAAAGCFHLADRIDGELKLVAGAGFMHECPVKSGGGHPDGCLARLAYESGQEVLLPELSKESRLAHTGLVKGGTTSAISVPVKSDGNVLGTLTVLSRGASRFDAGHLHHVRAVSHYINTAIERALLHQDRIITVKKVESLTEVVCTQNRLLRQLDRIYERFTKAALEGAGIQGIAQILADLVRNPVVVTDRFFKLLVSSIPGEGMPHCEVSPNWDIPALDDPNVLAKYAQIDDGSHMILQTPCGLGNGIRRIAAPVIAGNDSLAYIFVTESRRVLEEIDLKAVEHARTVLALEMQRRKAASEVEERFKGNLLRDVLMRRHPVEMRLMQRARNLGYDLSTVERVLIVDFDEPRDQQGGSSTGSHVSSPRALFELLQHVCAGTAYVSLVNGGDRTVVVLLYLADRSGHGGTSLSARELAQQVLAKTKIWFPNTSISIGVGGSCVSAEELRRSFLEAERSLQVMRSLRGPEQIAAFDELGVIKMLIDSEHRLELGNYADRMLKPLIDYDGRHSSDLARTLETWLDHNGNNLRTATATFVHVSTLKYRLKKIEELCHLDLNCPDARLSLQIALKITRLRGSTSASFGQDTARKPS